MTTLVVFWASLCVIIFFVLGMIFKALISLITAGLDSLSIVLPIGFFAGLLYTIINTAIADGIMAAIVLFVILLLLMLVTGMGLLIKMFFSLSIILIESVMMLLVLLLEILADICEMAHGKFLLIIVNRINMC